jgi:alkanesulfonate monooxygenase SsuD/methylene tetrahydromethanopterin reductase-like flavin-dependent oxidoreductase (luciferase family)
VHHLKSIWSGNMTDHQDAKEKAFFYPPPSQINGPPIWVAGNSEGAIELASEMGDGWHPSGMSITQFSRGVEMLRRSRSPIIATMRSTVHITDTPRKTYSSETGGIRYPIEGSLKQITEKLELYAQNGLEYLVCWFSHSSTTQLIDQLVSFADAIVPSFKS